MKSTKPSLANPTEANRISPVLWNFIILVFGFSFIILVLKMCLQFGYVKTVLLCEDLVFLIITCASRRQALASPSDEMWCWEHNGCQTLLRASSWLHVTVPLMTGEGNSPWSPASSHAHSWHIKCHLKFNSRKRNWHFLSSFLQLLPYNFLFTQACHYHQGVNIFLLLPLFPTLQSFTWSFSSKFTAQLYTSFLIVLKVASLCSLVPT